MSVYDRLNRLRQRYERAYGKSYKRSAARRKDEVEMLSLAAKLYWDAGSDDPENNWSQLLKAHALYNSCAVRCSGLEMEGYIEKACLVQNRYRHGYSTVSVRQLQKLRSSHKELIQGIRAQVRSDLKPMRVEVRRMKTNPAVDRMSESMRRIALVCNERMVGFAKRVVQDAIDIVGAPPCSFTVAGKGSLARGEATPYSDLEFFIIVEKKTAETKKYFMHLSMNIYFLIGNMQETKLKYMNIGELDWFDDQEMNGVKIDGLQRGAGNIPTGNGVTDRKNKYINSPEEFQEKYQILYANPDPEEALQGDDSAMVAFTTNIYSHTHPGSRPTDFLIQGIRAQVRSDLKPMRVEVRRMKTNPAVDRMSESMRRIALVCNERMVGFAKRVVQDAIDIVGAPPCSFTVAGKGSLARGEATPYSDLEFFIIVEKKTAETKKYFMHLSMNIYFLIGNMQETKLKYMNIGELDWFDDQEMNGVKIDGLQRGAGNIPTGNGVTDRKNKYINSPEEFQEKYKILYANPDPEEALQGDDSAMVAFTTNIYSHTHPGSRPTDFLGDFNEKQKAIPMTQERRRVTQEMLERDMKTYKFDPSTFCEDGAIEVKSKIYRFPSLMILDLSVLHEIHASSSWEALDQLYSRGKISHSTHKLLRNLLALASYLRMCTYLYHNSQREFMVLAQNAMDELNLLPTCRPGKPCYLASRNAVVNAVHCMRDLCSH